MAESAARVICASSALVERGLAVRFTVTDANGQQRPALAVRYMGRVYAYLNACQHIPVELDLQDGNVFDLSGHYPVCSMHGALYEPNSGRCVGGPCRGRKLTALPVHEADDLIWLDTDAV
ncbi:Rieske 2Fe-2S domain-containing protein [Paludibacterium sp. dN 18-1]|uniref:Rieske 2Fe-2S domain-containing protein n=1 Tax=Paludibacterium denitrificans TaxID=2675226 RepID=A0A844G9J3_9NEIS|nr:Rieske 2Fe-2S domain-containing protein [Paludibacterium denitrificans]